MKKFIKNTLIYMFVILLGLLSVEFALFSHDNEYSYKNNYLLGNAEKIQTIFLGHSNFETGINPSFIGDSCFNAAISGRGGAYENSCDVQLAERYIPQMKNLKYVILPLSFHHIYYDSRMDSIHFNLTPTTLTTYRCMNYKYLGIKKDWRDIFYWPELCNSVFDYWGRFTKTNEQNRLCDSLGYVKFELKDRKDGWDTLKLPKFEYHNRSETSSIIKGIKQIYTLCEKHGVKLIVITSPTYKTYNNKIPESYLKDFNYVVRSIKQNKNLQYYNFYCDPRFGDNDFKDAGHLNYLGAKKFSGIVGQLLAAKN